MTTKGEKDIYLIRNSSSGSLAATMNSDCLKAMGATEVAMLRELRQGMTRDKIHTDIHHHIAEIGQHDGYELGNLAIYQQIITYSRVQRDDLDRNGVINV